MTSFRSEGLESGKNHPNPWDKPIKGVTTPGEGDQLPSEGRVRGKNACEWSASEHATAAPSANQPSGTSPNGPSSPFTTETNGWASCQVSSPSTTSTQEIPSTSETPRGFEDSLFDRLSKLLVAGPASKLGERNRRPSTALKFQSFFPEDCGADPYNAFVLPTELQGGILTISSRRPSYAAEVGTVGEGLPGASFGNSFTSHSHLSTPIWGTHVTGSPGSHQSFQAWSPSRAPNTQAPGHRHSFSQESSYQSFSPEHGRHSFSQEPSHHRPNLNRLHEGHETGSVRFKENWNSFAPVSEPKPSWTGELSDGSLTNGLVLSQNLITASSSLRAIYRQTMPYYGYGTSPSAHPVADQILVHLDDLLDGKRHPEIQTLVAYIRNLNNLLPHARGHGRAPLLLTLVMNKNSKMEVLCLPNTNLQLEKYDLVVIDGDRGKDLVMVLKPVVSLAYAVVFNFLRKREHLRSLETQPARLLASDDNEFIISLPTKQVLRFATAEECRQLPVKYMEEGKSFQLARLKIAELGLAGHITLVQSEYQFDYKKLIFYYFAGFQRVDFRGLIKELFKVYKTRIWLCAVLPDFIPGDFRSGWARQSLETWSVTSVGEFAQLNERVCDFHARNLLSLTVQLQSEIKTTGFYGFKKPSLGKS